MRIRAVVAAVCHRVAGQGDEAEHGRAAHRECPCDRDQQSLVGALPEDPPVQRIAQLGMARDVADAEAPLLGGQDQLGGAGRSIRGQMPAQVLQPHRPTRLLILPDPIAEVARHGRYRTTRVSDTSR